MGARILAFLLSLTLSSAAPVKAHRKCPPKLSKASMLQRSMLAKSMQAAGKPDPTCKTGVMSLAGAVADKPQACCPSYCGECSDYKDCDKVRGQDSKKACCLTTVLDLECGGEKKPPANECYKSCAETNPPCIMEEGVDFEMPETTSAAEDCGEATSDWMDKAESAVKAAEGGGDQWTKLQDGGKISMAQKTSL
eukprot:gnl/MRDRNA2_/MRDRNA2_93012_c0_seq1.p1 gnl/MRDRNA2_/MRDRNA2_93012_c0~~gnl/MRDRNA2_/MRDRNA2_93012_c0_seq1.p1  ORF type:complete len:194 (-),score=59.57 gnl/MRDRNA2_/MRDRNA2_93012_c0_seq1:36-617(-)